MQGWIKDYRKEMASDIWLLPPIYHRVWQYLKYKVNHEPRTFINEKGEQVFVDKGETVTSLRCIAEGIKWYERGREVIPNAKTIKSILQNLEMQEMITILGNSKGTRIKVLNYSVYQGSDIAESNSQVTARKQPLGTNKNVKNVKNKYTSDFEEFWDIYPSKKTNNKKLAFKKWNAQLNNGTTSEQMIKGARNYAAKVRREGTEERYIKLAQTFIGPDDHFLLFQEDTKDKPKIRGSEHVKAERERMRKEAGYDK